MLPVGIVVHYIPALILILSIKAGILSIYWTGISHSYYERFHPRWALDGFGLFGEVADALRDLFDFDQMKPSFGGGIRFKLLKDQDTWIRADLGKGIDGSSGFYFGINEAF